MVERRPFRYIGVIFEVHSFLIADDQSVFLLLSLLFESTTYHEIVWFFCLLMGTFSKYLRCVSVIRMARQRKVMYGLHIELLLHLRRHRRQLESPRLRR